jgi:hypothetical protein
VKKAGLSVLIVTIAHAGFGADSISWSESVSGLKIGATYTPPEALRVSLQNVSSRRQLLLLGVEGAVSGDASRANVWFVCTRPDGKQCGLWDRRASGENGVIRPSIVGLNAGERYDIEVPTKMILSKEDPNVTVDELLKRGYTIRAFLDVTENMLQAWVQRQELSDLSEFWIGRVESAPLGLRK